MVNLSFSNHALLCCRELTWKLEEEAKSTSKRTPDQPTSIYTFSSNYSDSFPEELIPNSSKLSWEDWSTQTPPRAQSQCPESLSTWRETSKVFIFIFASERTLVHVGTVTDDERTLTVPKLNVVALRFTESARSRIQKAGGKCMTFDELV